MQRMHSRSSAPRSTVRALHPSSVTCWGPRFGSY
jgi:hypothetical protein